MSGYDYFNNLEELPQIQAVFLRNEELVAFFHVESLVPSVNVR